MTHVPCGGDIVERVCRNVVYYNDSMIGCYKEALERCERRIRQDAELGERESCLFYCDCMDGAKEKALEILRQRGFEVRMHVSYSGGIRQTPAFYAFW